MNTLFEKCAVAGDITKAIDRRGCWSVAITVIGGTESTAVKLQSCETADGVFTDYKELIPASEASADQYKGFVLDLYGAGKFIKVVGATMATAVLGDCDHDVKQIAITEGEIPSGADLEDNKEVTITENGTVEITPTEGKDGMKKVTATVNVPSSGGSVTAYPWKRDGTDIELYLNIDVAPSDPAIDDIKMLAGSIPNKNLQVIIFFEEGDTYTYVSDTQFTVTNDGEAITFIRDTQVNNFQMWG